jgi:hypothetical protein
MTTKSLFAVACVSLFASPIAHADDAGGDQIADQLVDADGFELDHHVDTHVNTVEVGVAKGYTQGAGPIGHGMQHVEEFSGAGGALELEAMYRINTTFAAGAYGAFSTYGTGDRAVPPAVFGATAGVQAAAHLRPERSVDPWASVGTGWHGLWQAPPSHKDTALQGLEIARVQLGVDYRLTRNVAIAPLIGGSLNMFVEEESPMTTRYVEIPDKKLNISCFVGVAGRFGLSAKTRRR